MIRLSEADRPQTRVEYQVVEPRYPQDTLVHLLLQSRGGYVRLSPAQADDLADAIIAWRQRRQKETP